MADDIVEGGIAHDENSNEFGNPSLANQHTRKFKTAGFLPSKLIRPEFNSTFNDPLSLIRAFARISKAAPR
jgi:hypothetical protein